MIILIETYKRGEKIQLSKNFVSTEFDCNSKNCSCTLTQIDSKLVDYLQKIRDHFGKPVKISSAYRCPIYNAAVGGTSGSKHMSGQAADIKIEGVSPLEIAKYAESIGCLGIGHYDTFVHIDTRTTKFFWYSDAQIKRTTFLDETPVVEVKNGKYIRVTGASVNIRKGPDSSYDKNEEVARRGQTYQVVEIPDNWVPIKVDNQVCFISKKYIEFI